MKRPRVSLRSVLILIAVMALLLAGARLLGRRPGFGTSGRYWWVDATWPFYHEVRGAVIYDAGNAIFVD